MYQKLSFRAQRDIIRTIPRFLNFHRNETPRDRLDAYVASSLATSSTVSSTSGEFLFEMVGVFLGCTYPTPPRILHHVEEVVKAYLVREMFGPIASDRDFSLFTTEGETAAMAYIFHSLQVNGLIHPGDKMATATPIFSPYLEIPVLAEYGLEIIDIRMDRTADWQLPQSEMDELLDPSIKVFCIVNPSNPPSSKLSAAVLDQLTELVTTRRPDLMIVTDDVYGTFADDFVSLFAVLPRNTLPVYSFSKFFGATGWRLGAIALHTSNIIDERLAAQPARKFGCARATRR